MINEIYERFNGISDEKWLDLLIRAGSEPFIDGVKMPGFPPLDFQINSVGSHGPDDLRYAAHFIRDVKRYAKDCGIIPGKDVNLLDFGVGWGRMVRFFFKDLPSANIFGIDALDVMVDYCNELLPAGSYYRNDPLPPTNFNADTFDIIMSYSVFSHLSPNAAEEWIKEFSRILKPGGIVVATTEGVSFLNLLKEIKSNPEKANEFYWYKILLDGFPEHIDVYQTRYEAGEVVYAPNGGANQDSSLYGDAIVPEMYVRNVFGKYLDFVAFDDNGKMAQARFVLRKAKNC